MIDRFRSGIETGSKLLTLGLATTIGAVGIAACGSGGVHASGGECYSDRAVTDRTNGDSTRGVTNDAKTIINGYILNIQFPPAAESDPIATVEVGFGDPLPHDKSGAELAGYQWMSTDFQDSWPKPVAQAHELAIGQGAAPTRVSARIKSANGSPACDQPPKISLSDLQPLQPLIATDRIPYPIPQPDFVRQK